VLEDTWFFSIQIVLCNKNHHSYQLLVDAAHQKLPLLMYLRSCAVLETSVVLSTAEFLIPVFAVVHKYGTSIIAFCVCVCEQKRNMPLIKYRMD